jgi:cell division protein FtsQ
MTTTAVSRPRTTAIHPRFRARRIAVKRDEGRKRLRRLVTLGVLVGVIAVAYLLTRSPLLDLDEVRIEGATNTAASEVIAAGGLQTGRPMTDLDIDRARAVIATLPWVDSVQVSRSWPGAVEVRITERRAIAALATDDGSWLVLDPTGRVLESRVDRPTHLPALASVGATAEPGASIAAAQPALALAGYLTADLRAWFVSVMTNPDGSIEADLASGIHVRFGSQAHLADKTIGLATVLTRVDLKDLERIDLTVPNSPVLTRRGRTA